MQRLVASTFGVGFIPRRLWGSDSGAGTFGAAVGLGLGLLLLDSWWATALAAAVATLASVWAAAPFASDSDPGWICIDEAAGTLVAMIGLTGWPLVAAVVVARLADIFKVLPGVARADAVPGSLGVTLDDLVAGLYGLGVGWLLVWIGL